VNRPSRQCGLTLIELLITMGILVLIVGILYTVFNITLRGWQKSDNMLQVTAAARVALDQMCKEIASANIRAGSNQYYCVGFDKNSGSGWRTDSIGDEFYFIAPLKPNNPDTQGASDLCEVGYWLDGQGTADTTDDTLRRFYVTDDRKKEPSDPEFDFNFATGKNDEFVLNITKLEFEFFEAGDPNPRDNWDSRTAGGPPAKIKINITVAFGKGDSSTNPEFISKDFSTIVSLPQ